MACEFQASLLEPIFKRNGLQGVFAHKAGCCGATVSKPADFFVLCQDPDPLQRIRSMHLVGPKETRAGKATKNRKHANILDIHTIPFDEVTEPACADTAMPSK
jgi:hypothetical protein